MARLERKTVVLLFFAYVITILPYVWFYYNGTHGQMRCAAKAIPIIIAAVYLAKAGPKSVAPIVSGLLCSSAGDVVLELSDQQLHFMMGLVSFLVAHLFYIVAFTQRITSFKPYTILPFSIFATILLYVLIPVVEKKLQIPIIVYAVVIAAMGVTAANARLNIPLGYRAGIWGACLFMASDGLLACNKFYVEIPNAKVYVMTTYYLAQFFIATSALAKDEEKEAKAA